MGSPQDPLKTTRRFLTAAILLTISQYTFAGEQSGPNPGNLAPTGSHSVSLYTGAYTYTYPIVVPPGRAGIQPDLKLLYNSQASNGWLGLGWDLSLGSIQRSTKNGVPTYVDSQDTFIFALQGQTEELVQTSAGFDSYGGGYREYRAKIESGFIRFRYYASATLWRAWTKDGKRFEFGGFVKNPDGQVSYWALTKIVDPMGNYLTITYPSNGPVSTVSNLRSFSVQALSPAPAPTPGAGLSYLPSLIQYTGNTPQGDSPTNKVIFTYGSRSDVISNYSDAFQQKIDQRLTSIQVCANDSSSNLSCASGSLVRTYTFNYGATTAGLSLLSSITISGNNGSSLPPTTFTYQDKTSLLTSPSAGYVPKVDFVWRYDPGASLDKGTVLVDVNGDGLVDVVQNISGGGSQEEKHAWLNTGNNWAQDDSWAPPVRLMDRLSRSGGDATVDEGVRFADINGDGLVDLLQGESSPMGGYIHFTAWLNNGHGWDRAPAQWNPPVAFVHRPQNVGYAPAQGSIDEGTRLVDVNGDGLPDIVQYMDGSGGSAKGAWINTGNGWQRDDSWVPKVRLIDRVRSEWALDGGGSPVPPISVDEGVRFADLNGDGLVDMIQAERGWISNYTQFHVWLNNGHGWDLQPDNSPWKSQVSFVERTDWGSSYSSSAELLDINGDGLPDIVQNENGGAGSASGAWLNTGNGWKPDNRWIPPLRLLDKANWNFVIDEGVRLVDLDNDGLIDICQSEVSGMQNYNLHSAAIQQGPPNNVLTSVTNELGGTIQISYTSYVQHDASLPFPVTVVQSVQSSDGMGNSIQTNYSFSGGYFYKDVWRQREFLGFRQVTTTDALGNYTVTHFLQNDNAVGGVNVFKGKISEQDSYDSSGNLLTKTVNTYNYAAPFPGISVYFPYLAQTDQTIDSKQSEVQYQYDSYGNLIQEVNQGEIGLSGDERTVITDYFPNTNDYLVSYPTHKKILNASGGTASESWFTYDNNSSFNQTPTKGLLTKTESWLQGGQNPIVTLAYDAYGNLIDQYDALWNVTSGAQGNHLHNIYESVTHQFLRSSVQGVGTINISTDTYTFDPGTGQMLSRQDSNAQTTSYQYDGFGRLSKVINPLDSSLLPTLSYQYNINTTPPHSIVSHARSVSGQNPTLDSYSFFDGLGRKRETKAPGISTNQIVSDFVTYDSRGMVSRAYLPYTAASISSAYLPEDPSKPYTTTLYDALGRVVEVDRPDGTKATKSYGDWSETDTDSNGHFKTYRKDAYGRMAEVDEHNQGDTYQTRYQYDTLGNLVQITNSQGQITALTYDTLGRKTSISDPQMGNWKYQYDANGSLVKQTDAKGQVVQMTYDSLSRLLTKTYPNATGLSYQYGHNAANFTNGRLIQVTDLSGTQAFAYDKLGRTLSKSRTIGGAAYVTQMTYDDLNRETSVTYPNSAAVKSNYDGAVLASVQDAQSGVSYASLTYDNTVVGKLNSVKYGNGMTSTYAYDTANKTFRLTGLTSKSSTAQILQNFGYTYDNVGNIKSISDTVGGMNQQFAYDDLDRLAQSVGPYGTKNYRYDSLGNLTLDSENTEGSWGFDDASGVTSVQGSVLLSNGRMGHGLYFDGNSIGQLTASDRLSPSKAISVECWVRPLLSGTTGFVLSKQGSYAFSVYLPANTLATGPLTAQLTLSSGQKTLIVPNAVRYNIWSHLVLTYDGLAVKVYVNGQLGAQVPASGTVASTLSPVLLGSGFRGMVDEVTVHPRALSAQEVLLRFQSAGIMAPNQPLTPAPVQVGQVSGQLDVFYGFKFAAWDLEGDPVKYRIDWGTGPVMETGYVPSGSVITASHSWNVQGVYSLRVQAVALPPGATTQLLSSWSPNFNIQISPAVITRIDGIPLIGAVSGEADNLTSSETIKNTAGEWVVGQSTLGQRVVNLGYQGPISDKTPWWGVNLGAQGQGGNDIMPPAKLLLTDFANLPGNSAQDIAKIALGLRQNGYAEYKDANGNQQLGGNRWIKFDYENRPMRIIQPDGTTTDFVYDFEGSRVKKTINTGSQTQTSTYIGQIYEITNAQSIQYITAGSLRVAMKTSSGDLEYFLPDHLGSTNVMADASQTITRSNQYTPFGSTYQTAGTKDSDYKFTGQRLDDSTGLYYYGARYYDPVLGRFITPDTMIQAPYDPQTLNRYTYCRNNPIRLIDPSGHDWLDNLDTRMMNWWQRTFDTRREESFLQSNGINVSANLNTQYKYGGDNSSGGSDEETNARTQNGPAGSSGQQQFLFRGALSLSRPFSYTDHSSDNQLAGAGSPDTYAGSPDQTAAQNEHVPSDNLTFIYNAGFHIPITPGPAVIGPNFGSQLRNPFNSSSHLETVPTSSEMVLGSFFDIGVSAGVKGLSNPIGAEGGPTLSFGSGRFGGVQFILRNSQDKFKSPSNLFRYIDGISVGIGVGVGPPVQLTTPIER